MARIDYIELHREHEKIIPTNKLTCQEHYHRSLYLQMRRSIVVIKVKSPGTTVR
jgi:hypothetical protein